jgi:hypothetical protein
MTFLSTADLRGHTLLEICAAVLARIQHAIGQALDRGTASQAVSDMQVRRLGVRECNGRALI